MRNWTPRKTNPKSEMTHDCIVRFQFVIFVSQLLLGLVDYLESNVRQALAALRTTAYAAAAAAEFICHEKIYVGPIIKCKQ